MSYLYDCEPCPWCGQIPMTGELREYGTWKGQEMTYHRYDLTHQCGHPSRLRGHVSVTVSHETEEGAIQKWNEWTRSTR